MYLVVTVRGYDRPEVTLFQQQAAAELLFEQEAAEVSEDMGADYGWVQLYRANEHGSITLLDEA